MTNETREHKDRRSRSPGVSENNEDQTHPFVSFADARELARTGSSAGWAMRARLRLDSGRLAMYVAIMALTIQLPAQENQSEFNVRRWSELQSDIDLAKLPHRIETDRFGRIIMSPPPALDHTRRVARILRRLHEIFPQGEVLAETAISTTDGVKVTDAAWLSPGRMEELDSGPCLLRALLFKIFFVSFVQIFCRLL
jgi:hypothetical protein